MKKAKWIYLMLIVLCAAAFLGYRFLDSVREDTRPPKIQVNGQLSISVLESREAMLQGVTATDDRDGDVTSSLVVESVTMTDEENTVRVVYAAFDRAGNVAKTEREIVLTDYASPRFKLRAPLLYPSDGSFNVLDRIVAEDVLDGDISSRIRATSLSDESIAMTGTHDVKFRVTNSMGDSSEVVLPVEVYPKDVYLAKMSLTDYLIYLPAGSAFNARDYLYEYTVMNETVYLRGTLPEGVAVKITGKVDTDVPGVYAVTYTVTQQLMEESIAACSKLIVIVEG